MGKRNPIGESSCWQQERTKLIVFALVLLMLVFCCTGSGLAQVLYGSLTGTVTDTSGAAVAGATVEAVNVATGASASVMTDSSGVYRFGNLQQGTYKVTISAPTFSKAFRAMCLSL
jgi:Carboxypeptidase regulatory-like domain